MTEVGSFTAAAARPQGSIVAQPWKAQLPPQLGLMVRDWPASVQPPQAKRHLTPLLPVSLSRKSKGCILTLLLQAYDLQHDFQFLGFDDHKFLDQVELMDAGFHVCILLQELLVVAIEVVHHLADVLAKLFLFNAFKNTLSLWNGC
jgi:hypothetical protein